MKILQSIFNRLTFDGGGDRHIAATFGCTVGVVVDTDDPLQMGRLRIYCPELNDDPKKVQHLPWAAYVSPYGGSIRNPEHIKGHQTDNYSTEGTTQYGFWAIPEMGANVLVTCINGDPRKRVWLGCMYEHKEVGGLFNGTYDWDSSEGNPDGPYCAPRPKLTPDENYNEDERLKIQPLYNNLSKAFKGNKKSREWKTRGADYSGAVNTKIDSVGTNENLTSKERDEWVKDKLGAMGYDWTAFKNLGAFLTSKLIGLMSPGLHSISLDDRPFNSRIKIRTTAGHQIILDDTNERIYISTYEGNSWIELDRSGNIDVYSDRRISMRAKKDINFSTDESFRVKAKKGIFLYAGDKAGQTALDSVPPDGQIRLHSQDDTHIFTEGSLYQTINEDMHFTMDGGDFYGIVKGEYNLNVESSVYNLTTPNSIFTISPVGIDIETIKLNINALSKVQISGGSSRIEIKPAKITLDAPIVAFNDFGTTITAMVAKINTVVSPPLFPVPQIVVPESIISPIFTVDKTEIAPWTNRVPDHEPWARQLKIDDSETQNQKTESYKKNVGWKDQYTNEDSQESAEPIGKIEGEEEIPRGEFWRR